jgi:hypothetical protein
MTYATFRQGPHITKRTRFDSAVCMMLLAVLLQIASLSLGTHSPSSRAVGESDGIVICSSGLLHNTEFDSTSDHGPNKPSAESDGKCCTPTCHVQGVIASGTVAEPALLAWPIRLYAIELVLPRQAPLIFAFEARAPPSA